MEHGPGERRGQALLEGLRRLWRWLRGRGGGGDGPAAAAPEAGGPAPAGYGAGPAAQWPTAGQQPTAPRESRRERRANERFAGLGSRMLELRGAEREAFEDAVLRALMKHKEKDTALWKAFQQGRMPVAAMYANNAYGRELLREQKPPAAEEKGRERGAPQLPPIDTKPAFNQDGDVDKALDEASRRALSDVERGRRPERAEPVSRSSSTAPGDPALVSPLSTFATPVSPVADPRGLVSPMGNSASLATPSHSRPASAAGRSAAPARRGPSK
ncbi:hypothetical protein [Streptomyces broussonetiae]|uniref:Uncharacterized protein n=1 Tax=Streptomyces broussonetiae TaxID=2686304 RepID=A0ABV5E6A5_9ACTN